jgi:hypothetical protein
MQFADLEDPEEHMVGGIQYFPSSRNITLGMTPEAEDYNFCVEKCSLATDGNCSLPEWILDVTSGVDITL